MAKFTIVKGRAFDCSFVVKKPGNTEPILIEEGDEATFTISSTGADSSVIIADHPLTRGTATDDMAGKFFLHLTEEQTALLPHDVEFGEDGFPLKATCKGLIDVTSQSEGKIYATVRNIYVESMGG